MSNAVEQLKELYAEKIKNGLLDVKFDFGGTATVEELCQEVLDMETAIAQGKFIELNFGDYSWKEK